MTALISRANGGAAAIVPDGFCDHCRAAATAAGVPFGAAHRRVANLLDAAFARPPPPPPPHCALPKFPAQGLTVIEPEAGLAAFLRRRHRR